MNNVSSNFIEIIFSLSSQVAQESSQLWNFSSPGWDFSLKFFYVKCTTIYNAACLYANNADLSTQFLIALKFSSCQLQASYSNEAAFVDFAANFFF